MAWLVRSAENLREGSRGREGWRRNTRSECDTPSRRTLDSRYTTTSQGAWSTVVYPSGRSVATTFNARGQAETVGSYVSLASYWPDGSLKQATLGNQVKQQGCYNGRQQMTGMRVTGQPLWPRAFRPITAVAGQERMVARTKPATCR